jgi:hypothetical protein
MAHLFRRCLSEDSFRNLRRSIIGIGEEMTVDAEGDRGRAVA